MTSHSSGTNTPPIEPFGIFGTIVAHQPGKLISDERGNWYQVTEPSTFCAEINRYNTPARLVRPAEPEESAKKDSQCSDH